MRKLLLGLLFLTLSFSAFSAETFTLDYKASYSEGLGLIDITKLDNILEDLERVEGKIHINLQISKAEGVDYDGEAMTASREKQIAFLRGLRLRDYIVRSLERNAPELIVELNLLKSSDSNQVKIEISTEE